MASHYTSCKLTESKALSRKKCKFLHTGPHVQVREAGSSLGTWLGPQSFGSSAGQDNLSPSLPASGFQELGSDTPPYANSLWQERHLLASPFLLPVPHHCQPPHVLSIFIWIGDQGINPVYTSSIFQSHYGMAAIAIFHAANESNWIIMTVDSIKQHLIGLLPRNFIFIVFSIVLPKRNTTGELSRTSAKLYWMILEIMVTFSSVSNTSNVCFIHSFHTLNTVSASTEKGKIT